MPGGIRRASLAHLFLAVESPGVACQGVSIFWAPFMLIDNGGVTATAR
jgi:hypothetical protein